jgi:hypothetical protein
MKRARFTEEQIISVLPLPHGERGGRSVKGETRHAHRHAHRHAQTESLLVVEHGEDFRQSLYPLRGVGGIADDAFTVRLRPAG